mgnify:CR=1 FL=1
MELDKNKFKWLEKNQMKKTIKENAIKKMNNIRIHKRISLWTSSSFFTTTMPKSYFPVANTLKMLIIELKNASIPNWFGSNNREVAKVAINDITWANPAPVTNNRTCLPNKLFLIESKNDI